MVESKTFGFVDADVTHWESTDDNVDADADAEVDDEVDAYTEAKTIN